MTKLVIEIDTGRDREGDIYSIASALRRLADELPAYERAVTAVLPVSVDGEVVGKYRLGYFKGAEQLLAEDKRIVAMTATEIASELRRYSGDSILTADDIKDVLEEVGRRMSIGA